MEEVPEPVRARADAYQRIVGGVLEAMALLTVHDLGVFQALLDGPRVLEELAGVLGAAPRRLRAFLEVVVDQGFLRHEGDAYALIEGDEALFHPEGMGRFLLSFHPAATTFDHAGRALEAIRQDRSLIMAGPGSDVSEAERRRFLAHLDARSRDVAAETARVLTQGTGAGIRRIADLGGGVGTYSHALLRALPEAHAALIDRPNAEAAAREYAAAASVGARLDFLGVDFLEEDWGRDYDLVLLSNLVHCYGPADNARLLARAVERLAPGGLVAVKDLHASPDRRGPPAAVRFAVRMALHTDAGDVYSSDQVAAWLEGAGLEGVATHGLEQAPESYLVVGRRPAT